MKASKFIIGGRYKYKKAAVAAGKDKDAVFEYQKACNASDGVFDQRKSLKEELISFSLLKHTPCTKRGYVEGDVFIVTEAGMFLEKGKVITLFRDDGTNAPYFAAKAEDGSCDVVRAIYLSRVAKKEL